MTQYKHKKPFPGICPIGILMILILIPFLASGCAVSFPKKVISPVPDAPPPASDSDSSPSHAAQEKKLPHKKEDAAPFSKNTIGCLLPLSGKYALFGQQALEGIQLAIQDIARQHGVAFTLIIRDTRGNPEIAAACVDELAAQPVMGIIGPLVTAKKAGERAEEQGIPMIALTQKTDFLSKKEFLFSNFITPAMQVDCLAHYIFHTLKYNTAGILYPEEPYGKTFMDLFWDAAVQSGAKITGVRSYDGSLTDFSKPMEKLTGSYFHLPSYLSRSQMLSEESSPLETQEDTGKITPDFQVLFIPDGPSRLTLLLPQLTFNDITRVLLVGTNLWHDPALLSEISRYHGNAVICDGYFGNSIRPEVHEFNNNFKELFQSEPGFLEAVAYDTAQIFFTASRDNTADSRKNLKHILQSGKVFHGITGDTYFYPSGIAKKTLFLLTVKKGKFVEISHTPSENTPTSLTPIKENQ